MYPYFFRKGRRNASHLMLTSLNNEVFFNFVLFIVTSAQSLTLGKAIFSTKRKTILLLTVHLKKVNQFIILNSFSYLERFHYPKVLTKATYP